MNYTTSFIVFPKHCNHHKDLIFGGAFMAELDLAAANCVRKILLSSPNEVDNAVTHKAEFEFMKPAYVGDILDLAAFVTSWGKKSITIKVTATRVKRHGSDLIAVAEFVFITIDKVESLAHHPNFLPYKEHGLKGE